jgi:hypothetical protein
VIKNVIAIGGHRRRAGFSIKMEGGDHDPGNGGIIAPQNSQAHQHTFGTFRHRRSYRYVHEQAQPQRHVGEEIGKGRKLRDVLGEMIMVAEGVATTRSVHDLAIKHSVELPISEQVYQVLFHDKPPLDATAELMTREAKGEA